jgi:hypothetical protein
LNYEWNDGYDFRLYLNGVRMEPNYSDEEDGVRDVYQSTGETFNATRVILLASPLIQRYYTWYEKPENSPPPLPVGVDVINMLAPFVCYLLAICLLFVLLLSRLIFCGAKYRLKESRRLLWRRRLNRGYILLASTSTIFLLVASSYLTQRANEVTTQLVFGDNARNFSASTGIAFLGLTWGAVGSSFITTLCLVVDMARLKCEQLSTKHLMTADTGTDMSLISTR